MTVELEDWPLGPSMTTKLAVPDFSSTVTSRTNRLGVSTTESSSTMPISAEASAMVALVGLLRFSAKDCRSSIETSSSSCTRTTCVVVPGAKVSVPLA